VSKFAVLKKKPSLPEGVKKTANRTGDEKEKRGVKRCGKGNSWIRGGPWFFKIHIRRGIRKTMFKKGKGHTRKATGRRILGTVVRKKQKTVKERGKKKRQKGGGRENTLKGGTPQKNEKNDQEGSTIHRKKRQ